MKKYTIALFILILLVDILINPFTMQANAEKVPDSISSEMKDLGMELIQENEELLFYMNPKTVEFAIVTKGGKQNIWYSNPKEAADDAIATLENKRRLQSQLSVRYLDDKAQEGTLNSHTDAILEEQFEIEDIENGVRVTYTLGKEIEGSMIPKVISIERMEEFVSQLGENDQKMVLGLYKEEPENDIYLLRSKAPSFRQEEAAALFSEIGYTIDEYLKDLEENGVEEEGGAVFTIPVEYKIADDTFLVSIDRTKVTSDGRARLTDIKLLEYFGAGTAEEEGYLFVPDGSGALIQMNNGKITETQYVSKVYGVDETQTYNRRSTNNNDLEIRMPVFGVKKANQAMFAIITDGASHASIYADVAGSIHTYNYVYPEFNFLPNGKSALESMTGNGALQLYQKENYEGKYEVTYRFLEEDEADYSGMAKTYQQYLVENDILTAQESKENLPFYMEVLGAVNVQKSILGVPYEGVEVLTTYEEATKMIGQLKNEEVANLKVILNGWFNGGVNHTFPSKIKEITALNTKGYKQAEFIDYTEKEGVELFFDVDFSHVYHDKSFDGFSKNSQATRYFDNTIATVGKREMDRAEKALFGDRYVLNSSHTKETMQDFLGSRKKKAIENLSLRTLTNKVSGDFSMKNPVDRQESVENQREALAYLKEEKVGLLGKDANDYAFDYITDIVEIPTHSNEYIILDETIPFYQMVLHGYMEYAANPLNLETDIETEYLKAIESGAGLYFTWIYQDNSKLKDSAFGNYYSVNFDSWVEEAIEKYAKMNDALKQTQNQKIIYHEKVQEKVFKTTYENNLNVYVNYNDKAVTVDDGIQIQANDFYVKDVK